MMGEQVTNSLADFLHRHQNDPNLLEGVVDAVEPELRADELGNNTTYVRIFRVKPTIKNPYGDRRYFFILLYTVSDCGLPYCELAVDDEVKISFKYGGTNEYHDVDQFANMTTGRVYEVDDKKVEEVRDE